MATSAGDLVLSSIEVGVYTVPTEQPEADGTLSWSKTVVVVVEPRLANGVRGLGYTYGSEAVAAVMRDTLLPELHGLDVRDTGLAWERMVRAIRNLGRPGVCSMAIAGIDIALWDTQARALDEPLHRLLGATRHSVPVYGSGGFTTYSEQQLVEQLAGWVTDGIPRVKMKVGMDRGASWRKDLGRVRAVRRAVGDDAEVYVDANGAYDRTQARRLGDEYVGMGVSWFEEPVSSDDLDGLAQLREALPLDVTAGEYGYHLDYFRSMLDAGAVDVMQADVSRCAGITEWLRVAAVCQSQQMPFSAHCGPSLHAHAACVPPNLRHIEYFHDHVRVDRLLFEGVLQPRQGALHPDPTRPGLGLELKRSDAERFRTS